jgi:hypothetical protein
VKSESGYLEAFSMGVLSQGDRKVVLNLPVSFAQVFVLFVTMCREAFDDFIRFLRDREVNSQVYKKLTKKGINIYL